MLLGHGQLGHGHFGLHCCPNGPLHRRCLHGRQGPSDVPRGGGGARGPGKSGGHVEGDPATRLDQDGAEVALRVAVEDGCFGKGL